MEFPSPPQRRCEVSYLEYVNIPDLTFRLTDAATGIRSLIVS